MLPELSNPGRATVAVPLVLGSWFVVFSPSLFTSTLT
jgi:hypothetical protein